MKKRIGAVVSLLLIMVMATASFCFAAPEGLVLEKQYPDDGATGTAVENVSVKLWFNKNVRPETKAIRKANKKAIKLLDEKGKAVPIYVAYNPDEVGQVMVLSAGKAKIKGDTKYTLTIDPSFQATDGSTLAEGDKITFTTLNQSRNTTINMLIMGVMMVGMIFFSVRSTRRQEEKEKASKGKTDTVNPYKEAKRTGKSVEEIVAKDQKKKEKLAAAAAKKAEQQKEGTEERTQISPDNKRVAGPRPISAAGSEYKHPKKKPQQNNTNKGTTKPKNQTGKQKNKKKKK